jgi:hypothetical protein
MTMFLLSCLVIFLISRIKETPSMLSEHRYYEKARDTIRNNEKFLNELPYDKRLCIEKIVKVAPYLYSGLTIFVYAAVGISLDLPLINLLSFVQICTVVITMRQQRNVSPISLCIDDFPFYRWYFLFNVVLDYIYYPLACAMLLG